MGRPFPSALSIAHRFDGCSWRDELADAGFHIWGLDFQGFGNSDPYPEMAVPAERNPALGRAEAASRQIERATHFIRDQHCVPKISIIAHSWGTIATGRFAGSCPDQVERLVFFGPGHVAPEEGGAPALFLLASRLARGSMDRFTVEVPPGESAVLSKRHLEWASLFGHRPGEQNALASERQDAERAVAGYRRRRSGRSRLRPWPHPSASRHHPRRMGQPHYRHRCALALRFAEGVARETRRQGQPRDASHASRRKPSRALPRDAGLPQRRQSADRATIACLTPPRHQGEANVRRNLRSSA
jgi:pimeloyl-ACP methyl ester carboxylesterase